MGPVELSTARRVKRQFILLVKHTRPLHPPLSIAVTNTPYGHKHRHSHFQAVKMSPAEEMHTAMVNRSIRTIKAVRAGRIAQSAATPIGDVGLTDQ